MKKLSKGEETLALHLRALKLPQPKRERRFHPKRLWRFDFCWPELKLAVEVDGMHPSGAHNTPKGIANDNDKRNAAARAGWLVLAYTTEQVVSGQAVSEIEPVLEEKLALESIRLYYEQERDSE